jgi:hypothetical protein
VIAAHDAIIYSFFGGAKGRSPEPMYHQLKVCKQQQQLRLL